MQRPNDEVLGFGIIVARRVPGLHVLITASRSVAR